MQFDRSKIASQVPEQLTTKKEVREQIGNENKKIGKSDRDKEKKSKFQTKVIYVAKHNDLVFKIKKREGKEWIIVESAGIKEIGKDLSERMKKIESTHLRNEKEILKKIMT